MFLLRRLDHVLNKVTMYRLVVYVLSVYLAIGLLLSFTGRLSLSGVGLITSLTLLLPICYLTNRVIGNLYPAARNTESWLITALILCCIMPPATTKLKIISVAVAGLIAMASKYVLTIKQHHIFNPAAIAVFVIGLIGFTHATWWIGSPSMLIFTLLGGFLIARKIRRLQLVFIFGVAALAVMLLIGLQHSQHVSTILATGFTSWPLVFFGTIMLTEPATMPTAYTNRMLFGLLVGALFSSQLRLGSIGSAPEAVLIIGNAFAYITEPRYKLRLKLKEKHRLSAQIYDYVFEADKQLTFKAGQYLEWTLPHQAVDGRGNRRSFTIASSPTEPDIHLGVKLYEPSSSFKRTLNALTPKDRIVADQLAGDFCLPSDQTKKLVFMAGGIGITPFRSMLKYLVDTEEKRDVILFYMVNNRDEAVYQDVIKQAEDAFGLKTAYVVSQGELPIGGRGLVGRLTVEQLKQAIPDYANRHYYISGPNIMVEAYTQLLHKADVPARHIVTDYFSGY